MVAVLKVESETEGKGGIGMTPEKQIAEMVENLQQLNGVGLLLAKNSLETILACQRMEREKRAEKEMLVAAGQQ